MSHGTTPECRVAREPGASHRISLETRVAEPTRRWPERGASLAMEAGEIGTWEWDIGSGEVQWSANMEPIHGTPPGSFGGTFEAYQEMIHPDDRDRVLAAIRACIEGRLPYEVEFRRADTAHGIRWVFSKGKVILSETGESFRVVGVCMDVTQRKRAEEAVLEANRRKDEFLAMVSHELRNPLGVIANAATVVGHVTRGDPVAAKASVAIQRQVDRMGRIVDDLVDVSRLAAGKLTLERSNVDLVALVHRCVHDFVDRRLLDQHRYELKFSSARANGDGPRLEQIVSNLLMNAIKYTPPGGHIVVEVEPDGGEAVLRVKDTGVGISPEILPRVFDLFFQSDRGLARRDGGLGVGLAIARRLVEAHGGRIDARSAGLNAGTEFTVRLPLAASIDGEDPQSVVAPRRRILLVDDNLDAREALTRLLEIVGHEVSQAGDGPSGLEAASRFRPEVAIIDIGLPGMNGFEVARRLKASASAVRLIALTGYGHGDHRRKGNEVGFETYLLKPVAFETLQRALTGA